MIQDWKFENTKLTDLIGPQLTRFEWWLQTEEVKVLSKYPPSELKAMREWLDSVKGPTKKDGE